jgi:hypothetical protein
MAMTALEPGDYLNRCWSQFKAKEGFHAFPMDLDVIAGGFIVLCNVIFEMFFVSREQTRK